MLNYVVGDATNPVGFNGPKLIVHVCNDVGAWGAGFTKALSKCWSAPEQTYRSAPGWPLGSTQLVRVDLDVYVVNLIGQEGIGWSKGAPIRYKAVEQGLEKVCDYAKRLNASVHMPRIGCGLAGGNWATMEPIIDLTLVRQGIEVTVYDLPGR